ncbi:MAG TPA: hypothetical protein VGS61_04135 [Acidimicrobiales bacterium]|nr:hypothetical protein [Acidimicrobiales bacterium]
MDHPRQPTLRILYWLLRRRFGRIPTWLRVVGSRMPLSFLSWGVRPYRLESKLLLPADTAALLRARVAGLNGCASCLDSERGSATTETPNLRERLDALEHYTMSPLISDRERAALDFATELTEQRSVSQETFAELRRHFFEREVCEIVWVVASENLFDLTNLGLGIGSDERCEHGALGRPARATAT